MLLDWYNILSTRSIANVVLDCSINSSTPLKERRVPELGEGVQRGPSPSTFWLVWGVGEGKFRGCTMIKLLMYHKISSNLNRRIKKKTSLWSYCSNCIPFKQAGGCLQVTCHIPSVLPCLVTFLPWYSTVSMVDILKAAIITGRHCS